jgi:hypothetical protein
MKDGVKDTIVGVGRNLREGAGDIGSGIVDYARGDTQEGQFEIASGLTKLSLQTPFDALLMGGGSTISAIQTATGTEPIGRGLSNEEEQLLDRVYGNSIDLTRIRIKEGDSGLLTLTERPFVLGDTIYFPEGTWYLRHGNISSRGGSCWTAPEWWYRLHVRVACSSICFESR